MKILKLLEYQEADKQYRTLNKNLTHSKNAKAVSSAKKHAAEAKDSLIKLDRMAGDLINSFDKKIEILSKNQVKVNDFVKVIEEVDDLKELEYVQKKLDELILECNQLGKDINALKDKIHQIKVKTTEAMRLGKESSEKYKIAKTEYDKLKAELNPQAKKIKDKIAALEKEINDQQIMDRYNRIKDNNIFPVLVKFENESCMGCGMNIASDLQSKLSEEGNLVECPNCGRLMYKEKQ